MLKRKQLVEIIVTDSEFGGMGYGYVGEIKVKMKNVIKGQKVKAYISKVRNNETEAKVLEVLQKSDLESQEVCKHYGECGGCFQQSIAYEHQLQEKDQLVRKLFEDEKISVKEWATIEGSPNAYAYRNKMEFSFGDAEKNGPLMLGMHKRGRHYDIVTVDECWIMDEDFRAILVAILECFREKNIPYYNSRQHQGYLRHLVVRKGSKTGEILINLVTTTKMDVDIGELVDRIKQLSFKGNLVGFLHTCNDNLADTVQSDKTNVLMGRDYFMEEILGLKFKISAFSFFQTNSLGAEKLYSIVRDFVGQAGDKVVFDLYCGTGTIGQIVAPTAKEVIGIEIVEEAVVVANENAKLNGLNNCKFVAGDVKKKIKEIKKNPDIIILDPPRVGIHPQALKDIVNFNAPRIVYVSCNPKTLVKDSIVLQEAGYSVEKVQCVDMFPHTHHVECVVLMSRVKESPNRKCLEGMNSHLEPSIKAEIVKLSETFEIQKVVLFGSRARGDFKKHSDIDLAVWMKGSDLEKADLISRIDDIDTLLKIDFIIINSDTDEGLLKSIEREGVTIYERY